LGGSFVAASRTRDASRFETACCLFLNLKRAAPEKTGRHPRESGPAARLRADSAQAGLEPVPDKTSI